MTNAFMFYGFMTMIITIIALIVVYIIEKLN